MAHEFVRWVGRRAIRWFYRESHFVGVGHMPATGPVLLVGNHPNDLPDVLLGYLSTCRPVRYVATAAAATSILVRWMYQGLGVIPVTRVKDARKLKQRGTDMASANRLAFERVTEALVNDDAVGVYPEGGVHAGPGIGPMRSGVAQLALEGSLGGTIQGLKVVPIGIQYEEAETPGTDVVTVVGKPLELDDWLRHAPERPNAAFTTELRRMLESVSRTAITAAEQGQRDRALAAIGASIAEPSEPPIAAAARVHDQWARLLTVPVVANAVDTIGAAADRAGGRPNSARDCRRVIDAAAGTPGPRLAMLVARAPVGLLGLALHGPIFALVWWLSRRISVLVTDRTARAIVPGLYLMFVWYLGLALVTVVGLRATSWGAARLTPLLSVLVGAAVLAVLPRLGDAGVGWRHRWRAFRLHRRVQGWPERERAAIRFSTEALRAAWASHLSTTATTVSGAVPA